MTTDSSPDAGQDPISNRDIERWSTVVLYDQKSGEIEHVHHSVTVAGGAHPREAELEEHAREALGHARERSGRPIAPGRELGVLHVDPRRIDSRSLYRVDPSRRALVAAGTIPAPGGSRRRQP